MGPYNEAAGDVAAGRLAHQDAARFYERALESVTDERTEAALYEKLGRALDFASVAPQARRAFERALAFYERAGEIDKCAELAIALAQQAWFWGDRDLSRAWRERALTWTAGVPTSPWRFGALVAALSHHALGGDVERAVPYLDEAERFSGTPTLGSLVRFHNYRGMIERERGNIARMRADFRRAQALSADLNDDPHTVCVAYSNAASMALSVGDVATAQPAFDEAIRLAREHFLLERQAYSVAGLAKLHLLLGNLERARALVLESVELSLGSDAPVFRLHTSSVAIAIGLRTGDDELIDRFAEDALVDLAFRTQEAQRFGAIATVLAEFYARRGAVAPAAELLHRAAADARGIGAVAELPIAVARYGDADDFPRMRTLLGRWTRPGNCAGAAYLALFDALAAERAGGDTVAPAGTAAGLFAQIGFPLYEALALEAGGHPKEALEIYRRTGAVADARRLEMQLNPVNRRGRAKSQLTSREAEVAELIAQGKSNKAIAEELSLSERTVEHHVASILGKLEATSRSQIAVAVMQARPN